MTADAPRPAFYALAPGGWRDYVTLLHPPYTLWHLGYVVIGGCLAPDVPWGRLALTVLAFFLALGVGAHALDELNGRPLRTQIPTSVLVGLAVASIGGAVAIGIAVAVARNLWLLPFIAFGSFIVCAYNLELFGGAFHNGWWLAISWGAFPIVTAYFAAADKIRLEALLAGAFGALLIGAQRALSTPVRDVRRRTVSVTGTIEKTSVRFSSRSISYRPCRVTATATASASHAWTNISTARSGNSIDANTLTASQETALRFMAAAVIALAAAMLALRLA